MMKKSLPFQIAWRYLFPPKKKLSQSAHWVAIAGIAMGVTSLIGTLGVMNGLQQNFISSILEVGSYHARIRSLGFLPEETMKEISTLPEVLVIEPLLDNQSLLEIGEGNFYGALLRAMPVEAYTNDKGLHARLQLVSGKFPTSGEILLGQGMYDNLLWGGQQTVNLVALPKGQLRPFLQPLKVSGTFKTGYYEYDRNMAIINLEDGLKYLAPAKEIFYGIKLKNPNHTQRFLKKMDDLKIDASSWRDYNRSFLGALRLERNMMTFLLSLIFVIVSVNIFQGRQREIEERYEEIAILRAIGANTKMIQAIFILQGLIIGTAGAALGYITGVLVTKNINAIFSFLEKTINGILQLMTDLEWGRYEPISLIGAINYNQGLPIMMKAHENLIFVMFAILSAVFSAWWASRYVLKLKPLEALKNH